MLCSKWTSQCVASLTCERCYRKAWQTEITSGSNCWCPLVSHSLKNQWTAYQESVNDHLGPAVQVADWYSSHKSSLLSVHLQWPLNQAGASELCSQFFAVLSDSFPHFWDLWKYRYTRKVWWAGLIKVRKYHDFWISLNGSSITCVNPSLICLTTSRWCSLSTGTVELSWWNQSKPQ